MHDLTATEAFKLIGWKSIKVNQISTRSRNHINEYYLECCIVLRDDEEDTKNNADKIQTKLKV